MMKRYSALTIWIALLCILGVSSASTHALDPYAQGFQVMDQRTTAPVRTSVWLDSSHRAVGLGPFLLIVDVSDPNSPVTLSQTGVGGGILDLEKFGNFLYVAADTGGLRVIDISDFHHPRELGVWKKFSVRSLAVSPNGKYVYVANEADDFRIIKVTDPLNPKGIRVFREQSARVMDLLVTENTLILASGPAGVYAFSIENQKEPVLVSRYKDLEAATRIDIRDRILAVADELEGLVFLNYPSWKDPRLKGQLTFGETVFDCAFSTADPNKVILALGESGHAEVDASNPEQPFVRLHSTGPNPVTRVVADDPHAGAFLHCGKAGFWQVDYPLVQVPQATQLLEGGDAVFAAVAKGNFVYVSDSASRIEVWDVSDPASPILAGTASSPGPAVHLGLWGDTLIASCLETGIAIYDVADTSSPVQTAAFVPRDEGVDGGCHQTDLYGDLLAIADGENGVVIYRMGDFSAPLATWTENQGLFRGVAFESSELLWCTQQVSGLVGLDLTTVTDPEKLVGRNYNSREYKALGYRDDTVFLSTDQGFYVIDVTDPEDPDQLAILSAGYKANLFSFQGDNLVVGCGDWGLSEFDITDRDFIYQTRQFNSPGYALSPVILDNGATYLADREGGAWVLAPDSCDGDTLLLPCEGDTVPLADPILFTWEPGSYVKFRVEVSIDPSFPSGKKKTLTSKASNQNWLKVPYWAPSPDRWKKITKNAKATGRLYWRVVRLDAADNKFPSETRIFYLAD